MGLNPHKAASPHRLSTAARAGCDLSPSAPGAAPPGGRGAGALRGGESPGPPRVSPPGARRCAGRSGAGHGRGRQRRQRRLRRRWRQHGAGATGLRRAQGEAAAVLSGWEPAARPAPEPCPAHRDRAHGWEPAGHRAPGLGTGSVPRGWAPCPRSLHCAPRWEPCRAVPPACAGRALRAPGQARRWDPRWAWSGGWQVAEGSGSPTAFWFCFVLFSSSFSFNLLSAQFCYS